MRGLVQPKRGFGLAYLDYESQEFAIAAALSGDAAMQRAYTSGDPYLWFAQLVGAVPVGATKETHEAEREQFKTLLGLAAMYQMRAPGLAWRLRSSVNYADELLKLHRHTFARYWKWQESVRDFAHLKGYLPTEYDWRLHVTSQTKDRTLTNFPMQAHGGEMLRLACWWAMRLRLHIVAPVHDAVLVEAPIADLDSTVQTMASLMQQASSQVLHGFPLRIGAKAIIRYPKRLIEKRGQTMWDLVRQALKHGRNGRGG
jgi:DNA polymerase I-like protein with 3'-5' exonuclease and polymerase domains